MEPGVFFAHIMRSGGTSVSLALGRRFPQAARYPSPGEAQMAVDKVSVKRLGAIDPAERERLRFVSVHMPAWVSDRFADEGLLRVTVLRDPVERTISHLNYLSARDNLPDDPGAIWDDETWRSRLSDYQTQLFADPPRGAVGAGRGDRGGVDFRGVDFQGRLQGALRVGHTLQPLLATGIEHPRSVGPEDLESAIRRLEAFDVVGVTTRLDSVVARVEEALGMEPQGVSHLNARKVHRTVLPELEERIAAACSFDRRLYERAVDLAGA